MNKNLRHAIFLAFIVAFLISAPLVIAYAMGYRYNFKKHQIESVGALFLNSSPESTDLFINNTQSNKKMPAKIVNLRPNNYKIRVEKAGYHTWEKNLEINSKQTTFAQKIHLFKKSEPRLLVEGNINLFSPSPNNDSLVYSVLTEMWEEVWLHNMQSTSSDVLLYRTAHTTTNALENNSIWWSPQGNHLLIFTGEDYFILNISNPNEIIFIKDIISEELTQIKWDNRSDSLLYGIGENALYQINLNPFSSEKIVTISDQDVYEFDYLVKNGFIYFIDKDDTQTKLKRKNLNDPETKEEYLLELNGSNFNFVNHNESFFALTHATKNSSILFNIQSQTPTYTEINSNSVNWNTASNKIAYHNDFELWYSEIDGSSSINTPNFVTRYSNTIQDILWHESGDYILFSNHNDIFAIELDERDHRNVAHLVKNMSIKNIATNFNGTILYFIGQTESDSQPNLYILEMNESSNFFDLINLDILK